MSGETNHQDRQDGEPKIVVDSDWKEQVEKEKELAAETASTPSTDSEATSPPRELPPPPPASFEVLVYSLFTQAMSFLGHSPDPSAESMAVNKPYAKHFIDTLEMLNEKTKGNLTDQESSMISGILHTLRMTYLNVKSP